MRRFDKIEACVLLLNVGFAFNRSNDKSSGHDLAAIKLKSKAVFSNNSRLSNLSE